MNLSSLVFAVAFHEMRMVLMFEVTTEELAITIMFVSTAARVIHVFHRFLYRILCEAERLAYRVAIAQFQIEINRELFCHLVLDSQVLAHRNHNGNPGVNEHFRNILRKARVYEHYLYLRVLPIYQILHLLARHFPKCEFFVFERKEKVIFAILVPIGLIEAPMAGHVQNRRLARNSFHEVLMSCHLGFYKKLLPHLIQSVVSYFLHFILKICRRLEGVGLVWVLLVLYD